MGIFTYRKQLKIYTSLAVFVIALCVFAPNNANALSRCWKDDGCLNDIKDDHGGGGVHLREKITKHTSNKFTEHRNWVVDTFFKQQVLPALMLFTEQMSAVAMQQTMAIGTFLDAKHQLETQRLLQELQVEAHRDYQPSEDFCWFGTGVRSLAATEQRGRANAYSLARRQIARELGEEGMGGASDGDKDKLNRWAQFLKYFCDPQDSDWVQTQGAVTGLASICKAPSGYFANSDIDYTRSMDKPRTLDLVHGRQMFDLTNNGFGSSTYSNTTERVIMALQNNLYGHEIPKRLTDTGLLQQPKYQEGYMALRSITAKRSVAQNSFNAIVGLKSGGTPSIQKLPNEDGSVPKFPEVAQYLGAIMVELGMDPTEVMELIGDRPSYYAQLELLAKKIYQNPDFYANLYDKPANVKRKSVALKAIELMVDRAIYESQIRQEMVTSVLLSTRLDQPFNEAQKGLGSSEQ